LYLRENGKGTNDIENAIESRYVSEIVETDALKSAVVALYEKNPSGVSAGRSILKKTYTNDQIEAAMKQYSSELYKDLYVKAVSSKSSDAQQYYVALVNSGWDSKTVKNWGAKK